MDLKHFSHSHGLGFHQVPQGSEVECSGCKSPASGNTYVCWQCNYFLHEQCFRAARSVRHPSHPHHPLTLVPFPTYPSTSFFCDSCKLGGHGFSYTCPECEFDMHVHCALMPNPYPNPIPQVPLPTPTYNNSQLIYPPQSQPQPTSYPPIPNTPLTPNVNPVYPPNPAPTTHPQTNNTPFPNVNPPDANPPITHPQTSNPQPQLSGVIMHFSHPHLLKSIEIDKKACSACEWERSGPAYCCTEPQCSFIIDKYCFDSPREIRHKSHPQHPLTLLATPPNGKPTFDCYACWKSGKSLPYACLDCSITLHIDCIHWEDTVAAGAAHHHALSLYYSAVEASGQEVSIPCDACDQTINPKAWRYYCRQCRVGLHTGCCMKIQNNKPAAGETEDPVNEMLRMQVMKMDLDLQMQMARAQAEMIASIGSSINSLI